MPSSAHQAKSHISFIDKLKVGRKPNTGFEG